VTSPPTTVEALASASKAIAEQLRTALIVVYTRNGNAAIRLASLRPWIPILALCPDETMRRRLSLVWGVESREIDVEEASLHLLNAATREAVASGLARPGDRTVISAGSMFAEQGVTDFLKIDCIP
jgi:pyruvate kinase